MTVRALPFGLLDRLVGRALDLDPETRDALAGFSGKVVDVEVVGAGAVRLRIEDGGVRVEPREGSRTEPRDEGRTEPRDEGDAADVTLRGAPLSLLRFALAGGREREALLLGGEVGLRGDVVLATRLQRIVARMDLDLEEALARRIGDVPAHELVRGARGLGGWMREAGAALLADVSEYLHHEAAMTPGREDVERFAHAVDDLRDDVERLEARIAGLERGR